MCFDLIEEVVTFRHIQVSVLKVPDEERLRCGCSFHIYTTLLVDLTILIGVLLTPLVCNWFVYATASETGSVFCFRVLVKIVSACF